MALRYSDRVIGMQKAAQLACRRCAALIRSAEKRYGIRSDVVWYDQDGNLVEPRDNPTDRTPVSPEIWFREVALRFIHEGVFRQKTGQVAIAPVMGQAFGTLAERKDIETESLSRIAAPVTAENKIRTMDYVFDLSTGGFSRADVKNILHFIRTEEAKMAAFLATSPTDSPIKVFQKKIDAGLIPTLEAIGADIWTAPHATVLARYTPGGFAWKPVQDALTMTVTSSKKMVIPRGGGGVWAVDAGGTFALHEDSLPNLLEGVGRVAEGEKVTDVFFTKDKTSPHGYVLKREFDIYVQKRGFAIRAMSLAPLTPERHEIMRDLRQLGSVLKTTHFTI